jgi:hypothetical protein
MDKQKQSNELYHVLGVVYLIRYGKYLDSGYIEKFASSEKAIKQLVKDDELVSGKCVIDVNVDFDKCEINYTYKDWDDEIEEGKLYFDKVDVV